LSNSEHVTSLSKVIASSGLGNQLFQFCFAHNLVSNKNKVIFENNPIFAKNRSYMLADFNKICHHLSFKTNINISHTSNFGRAVYKFGIADRFSGYLLDKKSFEMIYEDENTNFSLDIIEYEPNSKRRIYWGYWQHWGFIASQMETAVLDIQNFLTHKVQSIPQKFEKNKKLVIHVRREDYLARGLDSVLGVITPGSYRKIITQVCDRENKNLEVITVTDDLNLKNNKLYGEEFGTIIDSSVCSVWQTLKLMAGADYVISANSTLSWWGAVLAVRNGGVGFIPNIFFTNLDSKGAYDMPGLGKYEVEFF
jgi:hypothetical protein